MHLGELSIAGERRKKDEPFNPFARDASAQRNKRMSERSQSQRRQTATPRPQQPNQQSSQNAHNELAKRRQEALNRLGNQEPSRIVDNTATSTDLDKPAITNSVEKKPETQPKVSKEDRLAELRRKSLASREKAKAQKSETAKPLVEPATEIVAPVVEFVSAQPIETAAVEKQMSNGSQDVTSSRNNVFKKIQTEAPKTGGDRRRKRRRGDKKGGGRQKQEKKLNRQKYLEFKYAAKDILDSEMVELEHRSNILGQVWAKGERIGVSDSFSFIESKVEENILPREVADELRDLISRMTTRR
jgi:hypothetical protein|tara:strand:+ start:1391 stop:2293 length:903 start_codon:yes stop_codon:yes gene_type:complete